MIQRRQHLCFALETGHARGVVREGRRQHLDRHVPVELRIGGAIDGAHAALAELGNDAIVRNGGRWAHGTELCGMVSPSDQRYLPAASEAPPTEFLRYNQIDMRLARNLVDAGEREAVATFLGRCARFNSANKRLCGMGWSGQLPRHREKAAGAANRLST
jgi:hypothetical protein